MIYNKTKTKLITPNIAPIFNAKTLALNNIVFGIIRTNPKVLYFV